jgi:Cys-tRNA(Pro)/Cys-tRNA(Cys) deacylase
VTPAVDAAVRAGIVHRVLRYDHDPAATAFGEEAAAALELPAERVFKTLVVALAGRDRLGVALVPVARRLDLKAAAAALGAKRAELAPRPVAERATGYVTGGISPLGQRRRLPAVVDESVLAHPAVYVSGGRRGLELELAPADLLRLTGARSAPIAI